MKLPACAQRGPEKRGIVQQRPLHCVLLYTSEDNKHAGKLVTQLAPLVTKGLLTLHRYTAHPSPPENRCSWMTEMLSVTDRILLLATPRLFNDLLWNLLSEKLRDVAPPPRFKIIPIILEPCDWQMDPLLENCQQLPRNGRDFRHPRFFSGVAEELKAMAEAARQGQA
ncbi:hypothetical protein [Archangium lansingense]|uniref:TIR domain-containing protein n=1 Tax=Archangium lansingense TaxID=2995310 RepID=A0ABT4A2V3_9BACT|nr:hypothetical protein [Archangium lansinium]MCY1075976.1 hypothetical protein [Archangium lansinium]